MTLEIEKGEYYNITVEGHAGGGAKLLSTVAGFGVNLLAFKAVPAEAGSTRFSLFPGDGAKLRAGAEKAGLAMDGPYCALLLKGHADESGALADIYEKLSRAGVNIYESSGIANIKESYGVVFYLEQEDCTKAMEVLKS